MALLANDGLGSVVNLKTTNEAAAIETKEKICRLVHTHTKQIVYSDLGKVDDASKDKTKNRLNKINGKNQYIRKIKRKSVTTNGNQKPVI